MIKSLMAIAGLLLLISGAAAQLTDKQVPMQNRIDALEEKVQRLERQMLTHERLIDGLRAIESVRSKKK